MTSIARHDVRRATGGVQVQVAPRAQQSAIGTPEGPAARSIEPLTTPMPTKKAGEPASPLAADPPPAIRQRCVGGL